MRDERCWVCECTLTGGTQRHDLASTMTGNRTHDLIFIICIINLPWWKILLVYKDCTISEIFITWYYQIVISFLSIDFTFLNNFTTYFFTWGQWRSSTRCDCKTNGCGFDPHSRLSAALSSATQHAMPPEFGRKWGTECLNTRFHLHTRSNCFFYISRVGIVPKTILLNKTVSYSNKSIQ